MKNLTTAERIERALDRLRQRHGVSGGFTCRASRVGGPTRELSGLRHGRLHVASRVGPSRVGRLPLPKTRTRSKSRRHSPPASLLGSSTNALATRWDRRSRTAQRNRTQGYAAYLRINHVAYLRINNVAYLRINHVAYLRINHHGLLLGTWSVLTLKEKSWNC